MSLCPCDSVLLSEDQIQDSYLLLLLVLWRFCASAVVEVFVHSHTPVSSMGISLQPSHTLLHCDTECVLCFYTHLVLLRLLLLTCNTRSLSVECKSFRTLITRSFAFVSKEINACFKKKRHNVTSRPNLHIQKIVIISEGRFFFFCQHIHTQTLLFSPECVIPLTPLQFDLKL